MMSLFSKTENIPTVDERVNYLHIGFCLANYEKLTNPQNTSRTTKDILELLYTAKELYSIFNPNAKEPPAKIISLFGSKNEKGVEIVQVFYDPAFCKRTSIFDYIDPNFANNLVNKKKKIDFCISSLESLAEGLTISDMDFARTKNYLQEFNNTVLFLNNRHGCF